MRVLGLGGGESEALAVYWLILPLYAGKLSRQTTLANYAGGVNNMVTDFQGNHQTIAYQYNMTIGSEVPEHRRDAASLAFPGFPRADQEVKNVAVTRRGIEQPCSFVIRNSCSCSITKR